ncbi:MAG: hypothetical protein LBR39_07575 [Coriobacteriales bacterium]|jgi:hypothetical protein|nr:hypothetical protein [Coriobacteriales bacterium]
MEKKESSAAFWIMMVILAYMLIACVILPLASAGFTGDAKDTYTALRLPLMGLALALPFIHFFIFAGIEIINGNKK